MLDKGKISYEAPLPGLSVPEMMEQYSEPDRGKAIAEYFAHHIRYYTTFWNVPDTMMDQYGNGLGSQYSKLGGMRSPYPVDQINENMALFLGEQVNLGFAFMQRSVSGQTLAVPMRPSQKGFQIVNYLTGTYAKAIRIAKPHCKPISREAISKREYMLQLAEITASLREEFASLAENTGVMIGEEEILGADSSERIEEILARSPRDKMEILGNEILEYVWKSNSMTERSISSYMRMCIGKYAAFHCRIQNGLPFIDIIDNRQLVFDSRTDDEFNARGRFEGIVEFLTANEIAERNYDGFTSDDLKEMLLYNKGQTSAINDYAMNVSPNLNWFSPGEKIYTVATFYWRMPRDLGIKYKEDPKSKSLYRDVRKVGDSEDFETGDFFKDVLCCGTLIGNWKLVNYGELAHIPYNPGDKLQPLSPIQMLLPDVLAGRVKSKLCRVRDYISQLEAYKYKISQKAAKAHGKVPVLNAAAFKKGPAAVMNDIVTWGFTFANFSNGEWLDPSTNKQLTGVMDFTMDSDIQALMALANTEEAMIDSVFNTTPIAMGRQETYVGYGTQQDTIAQATLGTANETEKHAKLVSNTLYVMVNMMKNYYSTDEGKKKAEGILSMSSYRFLMQVKDLSMEDLGVYVTFMDSLDEKQKAAILTLAQTTLPAGIDPEVLNLMIDLISSPSATEMRLKIDAVVRNIKKQRAAAEADKAAFEAQQAQQANQVPLQKEQIKQAGEDGREAAVQEGQDRRLGFEAEMNRQSAPQP